MYFYGIGIRVHRAPGSHYTNSIGCCIKPDHFGRWPDYPKHSMAGILYWQYLLLDCSQCFGRSSITGKDNQRATLCEKPLHTFKCIIVYRFKGMITIWGPGIVAQIYIIVFRKLFSNRFKHC